MSRIPLFVTLALLLPAGCANFNTVGRKTSMPDGGVAIHLDAPQRLTVANKEGFVCSEPSPDALQAYTSSLGLSFAAPTKESVSIANSLAANAGSIGLRTQSITLMRDALFRICELYYNKAISKAAAVQLLQRSQDLTLGVLAIEQLTGAVVAQQVKLTGGGSASGAATINDTKRELDRAKKDLETKKKALEAADKAAEAQSKSVAEKKAAADAAKEKAAGVQKQIDGLAPNLAAAEKLNEENAAKLADIKLEVQVNEVLIAGLAPEKAAFEAKQAELTGKVADAQKAHDAAADADKPKLKKDLDGLKAEEAAAKAKVDEVDTRKKGYEAAKLAATQKLPAAEDAAGKSAEALKKPRQAMALLKAAPEYAASQKAAADLKTATDDETKKKSAAEDAKTAVADATEVVDEIGKIGDTAIAKAGSTITSSGEFSPVTERYGVSKDTAAILAQATHAIVETVMNKGHMTDTCGVLLMSEGSQVSEGVLKLCSVVILQTLEVWKADALRKIADCARGDDCSPSLTPFAPPLTSAAPQRTGSGGLNTRYDGKILHPFIYNK